MPGIKPTARDLTPHKSAPVRVTPAPSEAQEYRRIRMELRADLRRAEWKFDQRPTLELVEEMRLIRDELSTVEEGIVHQTMRGRSRLVVENARRLVRGGDAA